MVSHFIYKCTLFRTRHSRHIFSILMRLPPSYDVAFLTVISVCSPYRNSPILESLFPFKISVRPPFGPPSTEKDILISKSNKKRETTTYQQPKTITGGLGQRKSLWAVRSRRAPRASEDAYRNRGVVGKLESGLVASEQGSGSFWGLAAVSRVSVCRRLRHRQDE